MMRRPTGIVLRILGSVALAVALLATFLFRGKDPAPPGPPPHAHASAAWVVASLDAGIDSVLSRFGVAAGSVKKHSVEIPGEGFTRTEWLVPIPDTVVPVAVNAALNMMARPLGARAVASENPRLRIVTIHLELGGTVVHTVILRKLPPESSAAGERSRAST